MAGSIYEYGQVKEVSKVEIKEMIPKRAFFSDDTILIIAILDVIENNDSDYEKYLKMYGPVYICQQTDSFKWNNAPFPWEK